MADSLSMLQEKIIAHSYFQKTKDVVEDNACHHKEKVYDHLLATAKRAEEVLRQAQDKQGNFITNKKARELFLKWMEDDKSGMKYKDVAILIALLHDIGKILVYEEDGKTYSIIQKLKEGTTFASGHEYWGSSLALKILTDVGVFGDSVYLVAMVIKLHGSLMFPQFDKSKSIKEHISDMKTLGQGLEKEILFNIYADVAMCEMFGDWLKVIKDMFNTPEFYQKREYKVSS